MTRESPVHGIGVHPGVDAGVDAAVDAAVAAVRRGEIVVVVDDETREDEGDLVMAAELATPERLAFFVRHTSGLLCAPLTAARCAELELPQMVPANTDHLGTAFTVSVDLRHGTTTGISAGDRAATVRALADPATVPDDLSRPGHVFPLRARDGGVLARPGHTEAAVDLARLAGLSPAGLIGEVVNDDGTMARRPDLRRFCTAHGLPLISIAQLIEHRRRLERTVVRTAASRLPTAFGDFVCHAYRSEPDGATHVAMVLGEVGPDMLVRVHSECLTGDVLGSTRCDCGDQLRSALRAIGAEGRGVLVYMRGHEGRGIGISDKLAAYALQDGGRDTVDANLALGLPVDSRSFRAAADILADLGVTSVRLLTNNPDKVEELRAGGVAVSRVPASCTPTAENLAYLLTKCARMGHLIDPGALAGPSLTPVRPNPGAGVGRVA